VLSSEAAGRYLNDKMAEGISDRYGIDAAGKPGPATDGRVTLVLGPVLFHSGKMSLQADGLMKILDKPFLYIAPEDAERLGASEGDRVRVRPVREGKGETVPQSVEATVKLEAKYPPGMVFFPESFNEPPVKDLLTVVLDPVSKVPAYKTAEVLIEKI